MKAMDEMDTGFWFYYGIEDSFGISFALVYTPEERTIQITGMVGYLMLGVGYTF